MVVRPWLYSVGWNFKLLELDWWGQSSVRKIQKSWRLKDRKLLSFCHIWSWRRCV